MNEGGAIDFLRTARPAAGVGLSYAASAPPPLVARREEAQDQSSRRSKIWELADNLHCSIIGTCLGTGELRQLLSKLRLAPDGASDHDLHATAVILAGRHDLAAKLLNKALDQRHRTDINRARAAKTEVELRAFWQDAMRRGEIPGAYWATLTHPAATHKLIREAFGDVHMLSHLVGAANRADLRRLCELEEARAVLEAKVQRQQDRMRAAVIERDGRIAELEKALAARITEAPKQSSSDPGGEAGTLSVLVASLERRLATQTARCAALEQRLAAARCEADRERKARLAAERCQSELQQELDAIEASRQPMGEAGSGMPDLNSCRVLYVGGRPYQIAHLRAIAEQAGASFLHHDGGVEDRETLLSGMLARADVAVFPVDCISHDAALMIKRLCRQAGKLFLPLRTASAASLLVALQRLAADPDRSGFRTSDPIRAAPA